MMPNVRAEKAVHAAVETPWAQPVEGLASAWEVNLDRGLPAGTAQSRLRQFGANLLREPPKPSWLRAFLAQFLDWMIGLLLAAAVVSGAVGEWEDSLLIAAIVVVNALIGFAQERRAERAMEALKRLTRPTARVLRDGATVEVPVAELVPGDVVVVAAGTVTPADGRVAEAADLQADESALTGESMPVDKDTLPVPGDAALPDRSSMLFAGTAIVSGRGRMVVTSTGMSTELGRIAELLESAETVVTPLQRRLVLLSKQLAVLVVIVCGIVFAAGIARGNPLAEMVLVSISLAVAAIPEGLPAVITIVLALGTQRMARRQAIVRRLSAVETLGSVSVICTDKTGTLTQNKMSVREIVPVDDEPPLREDLIRAAVLCNDARLVNGQWTGSATEAALVRAAEDEQVDVKKIRAEFRRVGEFPFNSKRKRMSTLHRVRDGLTAYVKGAPEAILAGSTHLAASESRRPLTDQDRSRLDGQLRDLAGRGRRVVGFARRTWSGAPPSEADAIERELEFLGYMAIFDPPRPEAGESIGHCRSAGIQTVMITGDHQSTAVAVGSELGLYREGDEVITGRELEELDDAELKTRSSKIAIYARVSPEHKLRIVRAHQARGASVAMTGDGVNDAPALKQADMGVAMGITGTDVSKEVARIVLADDNFATIVAAVEEGRAVYDNIRKCVLYLLTSNASEIVVIFVAILNGWPLPLLPVHLLWINLVTDGLPALALAYEAAEPDVMRRPPRPRDETLFAGGLARDIVLFGLLMAGVSLGIFDYFYSAVDSAAGPGDAVTYARTAVFLSLSVMQLLYVLSLRSATRLVMRDPPWHNWRLLAASVVGVVLQLGLVYVPMAQRVFRTTGLAPRDVAICLAAAAVPFVVVEIRKAARMLLRGDVGERIK